MAPGAGVALAAWSDGRAALYGGDDAGETHSDIWIQLLGPQGEPLWTTPRRVAATIARDVLPRVTWNGSSWLVSWLRQPLTASNTFSRVLAVRVDASGTVLDPQPLVLFAGTFLGHSAASDGQGWIVLCTPVSGAAQARTVSAGSLNPLGPTVPVGPTGGWVGTAAFAQGAYLITSSGPGASSSSDVFGQRFDAALNPVDAAPFPIIASSESDGSPLIASNGAEFLLAWSVFDVNAYTGVLRCARLSAAGAVLSNQAMTGSIFGGVNANDIAWDGAQWFVATTGDSLTRVTAAGHVLDFNGFRVRPADFVFRSSLSIAAANGGGVRAIWMQPTPTALLTGNTRYEVRSSFVTSPVGLGVEHAPAPSAPSQSAAALASGGASHAVLLRTENGDSARLKFARVDSNGAPLDAEPVLVASASDIRHPSLAWDGERYLAVWIDFEPFPGSTSIRARRIAADGTLLDAAALQLGAPSPGTQSEVDVAARNGEFAVVAARMNDLALWRVRGSDGALLSGPVSFGGTDARRVSICATPGGFAAGWTRYAGIGGEVVACLFDAQGAPGTPFVVEDVAPNEYFGAVSLATSGAELLYAWEAGLDHQSNRAIFARRYDLAGAPLDADRFPVAPTVGREQFFPDLAWDGVQYVCAYQELLSPPQSDVRIARISTAGVVLDVQGFAVEATGTSEGQPAALGLGAGRTLVASSVLRLEEPYAAYRVALRAALEGCPPLANYCTAKLNSQGCLPSIAATGTPSASGAGPCIVTAANVLNGTNGLLHYGLQAGTTPFQGGFMCVAAPRRRTPLQNAGALGAPGPCDGQFTFDLNAYISSGADPLLQNAGQTFACQYWSRDPGDAFGSSLSNALQGVVCW